MKNMKVAQKLLIGFMAVLVLTTAVGVIGIAGLSNMNGAATEMYTGGLTSVEAIGNLREIFGTQRSDLRSIFLSQDDPAAVRSIIEGLRASDAQAEASFAQYETTIINEADEATYFSVKGVWQGAFYEMKEKVYAQAGAGDFDAAYETFTTDGPPVVDPIATGLAASNAMCKAMTSALNERTDRLYLTLFYTLAGVIAAAIAIGIFLALYISGLICKPLVPLAGFMKQAGTTGDIVLTEQDRKIIGAFARRRDEIGQTIAAAADFVQRLSEVSRALETVSNGDLTVELAPLTDRDTLGLSLQKMTGNLNTMFSEINAASEQVSSGSGQIADGAQSLAQGSTEQTATVQELSASIADIAEKTKANAERAGHAAELADSIRKNAEKGSRQMTEMVSAVGEISRAGQDIGKVIKVIDDIAFQTNILALNAAVEAARAGQHGKGFAVVSEEVRNLAAKSAEAAKDTSGLIANSIEKAELGSRIANETAASLSEIVTGIEESSKISGEIAASSEEQAGGITMVNTGIDQVAQVVQQNSATAEESAAASEELSGQSAVLRELIAQFKLRGADAGHGGIPAPRAGERLGVTHGSRTTGFALGGDADKY